AVSLGEPARYKPARSVSATTPRFRLLFRAWGSSTTAWSKADAIHCSPAAFVTREFWLRGPRSSPSWTPGNLCEYFTGTPSPTWAAIFFTPSEPILQIVRHLEALAPRM